MMKDNDVEKPPSTQQHAEEDSGCGASDDEYSLANAEDLIRKYEYGFTDSRNDTRSDCDDAQDIPVIMTKLRNLNMSQNEQSTSLTVAEVDSDSSIKKEDCPTSVMDTEQEQEPKGRVRFGRIELNEFRMSLGHNPCTRDGVPVELSWDLVGSGEMTVDAFESSRRGQEEIKCVQRKEKVRTLTREERLKIAEENHSFESVLRIYNEVQAIKQSRHESEADDVERAMAEEQKAEKRVKNRSKKNGADKGGGKTKDKRKWSMGRGFFRSCKGNQGH